MVICILMVVLYFGDKLVKLSNLVSPCLLSVEIRLLFCTLLSLTFFRLNFWFLMLDTNLDNQIMLFRVSNHYAIAPDILVYVLIVVSLYYKVMTNYREIRISFPLI